MNLAKFDLNLLLAFEALFEARAVTGAARRIGLGQSGMSAALARLRELLKDDLFVRVGGEMRPTARAIELAPGIAEALTQIRRTLEAGLGFDPAAAARSFSIGSADYTALVLLPSLMPKIRHEAPAVDVRIVGYDKDSVPDMLDRGEMDVAVGVFAEPPGRMVATPLFRERFVGLARADHPAIVDGKVDVLVFAGLPHALVTYRRDGEGALDEALSQLGLRRRVALTSPYLMAMVAALEATDMVTALPSRLADRVLATGRLQRFELPVATAPWSISMIWPATARNNPATIWLRGTIAACAAKI